MKTVSAHAARIATAVAVVAGLLLGGFMFHAAGVHNPQQEFHGGEWSNFFSWAFIAATWFAAGFIVSFAGVFLVAWAVLKLLVLKEHA